MAPEDKPTGETTEAAGATVTAPSADDGGAGVVEGDARGAEDAASVGAGELTAESNALSAESTAADTESDVPSGAESGAPTDQRDAGDGNGAADGDTGKKKRRRRRKKKPAAEAESEGQRQSKREKDAEHKRPSHRPAERTLFHVGEDVFGKVTAVLDTAIMVDLSGKALAIFDRSEMEPDDLVPEVSDRFVARVHQEGSRGGLVVLTRKPLREEQTRPLVEQAAKDGTLVSGLITGVIKGGIEVDIGGMRAFAPASGMDLHPNQANFAALLGQRLDFKVIKYDALGRDVVVTRRPMLEAEAHERRKHALTLLQEGQVVKGVVRTVVEWGAFVQLPEAAGLEGLVHISEASHDPRAQMTELVSPGDEIEVQITKIDDKGKIWLSRKAVLEDPWAEAKKKFAAGSRHRGKVTRLENFGVFVELEAGVEGLIHISDLTLQRIEHPREVIQENEEIDVVVHHFDARSRKLVLHPAPKPEHAAEQPQKIARNAVVRAEVVKGEQAGLIVRLLGVTGRAARGFVPAGQTGTARGTDLRKAFKPGALIEAKVIDIDPRHGEPKLSIRGVHEDEERRAHKEYRQKLKQEAHFGTLGDLLRQKLAKAAGSEDSND